MARPRAAGRPAARLEHRPAAEQRGAARLGGPDHDDQLADHPGDRARRQRVDRPRGDRPQQHAMVDAGISADAAAIKNRSSALITGSRPRWREAGCQRQQMRQHRSPTDTKPAGAAGERGELRPTAPLPVAALIALPAQGSLSSLSLARDAY